MSLLDDFIADVDSHASFGDYQLQRRLGSGQQGVVVEVIGPLGQSFALKVLSPTDTSPQLVRAAVPNFIRETEHLASLHHKNVASVVTGGTAKRVEGIWEVTYSFPVDLSTPSEVLLFYVMEYLENGSIDIIPGLGSADVPRRGLSAASLAVLFEAFASQVGDALVYLHSKNIAHKDLKPSNIRFRRDDECFVITDFGFARHLDSAHNTEVIERHEFEDLPTAQAGDWERNDVAQLALILLSLVSDIEPAYDRQHIQGIRSALQRAVSQPLQARYATAADFLAAIRPFFGSRHQGRWKLVVRNGNYLTSALFGRFDGKLRIPGPLPVPLSQELRTLIDLPEFQRLRWVKQLGPTALVYPGATHTRFEHSLGAFALAVRYLERLQEDATFRALCDPVDETIRIAVLVALLHDIGHYPFSHWVEELDSLPKGVVIPSHEQRAADIISNGAMERVIRETWDLDPLYVAAIIDGQAAPEDARARVLVSMIDSIIDVDKSDYLQRDSTHCGVPYGLSFDISRLTDSLCVHPDGKISLTEKGRSIPLAVISARNVMYQEVYWHKSVRAADSMFKRLFFETAVDEGSDIVQWLALPDELFVSALSKSALGKPHRQTLAMPFSGEGRFLYKPAFVFSKSGREADSTLRFFTRMITAPYSTLVAESRRLSKILSATTKAELTTNDILIDRAPVKPGAEQYRIDHFQVYNKRRDSWESLPQLVAQQNHYLEVTQQAYVFCSPRVWPAVQRITQKQWDDVFSKMNHY